MKSPKKIAALSIGTTLVVAMLTGCAAGEETMTLTQPIDGVELHGVDVNHSGDEGDYFVFETPILRDGQDFGILIGTITRVSGLGEGLFPDREERMSTAVFDLPGGQISVLGVSYYVPEESLLEADRPMTRAILGGTGAYFGVNGEVTTTRNADNSYTHLLRFKK